jgi:hypothetical protein
MSVVAGDSLTFADLPGRRSANPFPEGGPSSSVRLVELERTPAGPPIVTLTPRRWSTWKEGRARCGSTEP